MEVTSLFFAISLFFFLTVIALTMVNLILLITMKAPMPIIKRSVYSLVINQGSLAINFFFLVGSVSPNSSNNFVLLLIVGCIFVLASGYLMISSISTTLLGLKEWHKIQKVHSSTGAQRL